MRWSRGIKKVLKKNKQVIIIDYNNYYYWRKNINGNGKGYNNYYYWRKNKWKMKIHNYRTQSFVYLVTKKKKSRNLLKSNSQNPIAKNTTQDTTA